MSWSKLKNIIILILVLLNGFLLALAGVIQLRSARYEAQALWEAAAVLERSGITVQRESLPSAMPLSAAVYARDGEGEAGLAAALLGGETQAQTDGGLSVYQGAGGTVTFRSTGEFSAELAPEEAPPNGEGREAQVRALLAGLGVELWQVRETENRVEVFQSVGGVPVFPAGTAAGQLNAGAAFTYDAQGRLSRVSGRLLLGRAAEDPEGEAPLSVPTVLIAFLRFVADSGDVCQELREMTPAYRAAADSARLTPVWRIATDGG